MLPTNPLLSATAPAGPHLPTATLRQYAAGALAPAARHRVEAHTLACPRCADILEGLLQTTPATTDQALAQLQQRLRRRVQQAPAALPATRTRHSPRWLVPQLAAAAALLFGLVAGGWWTWQQRHASAVASRPAAGAPAASTPARPGIAISAAQPISPTSLATPARPPLAQPAGATSLLAAASGRRAARRPLATLAATSAARPSGEVAAGNQVPAPPLATAGYDANTRPATPADSVGLSGRVTGVAVATRARVATPLTLVRAEAMPAAPALPPVPQGGYPAWREKIRREAAEFRPEAPEQPLSGSVQLRVMIGADGKVQEVRILHGLRADYDEEAQRLVCDGSGWVPGIGGGKRAAQAVDIAVPF